MVFIAFIMTLAVLVTTLLSCVSDIRSLRIPNWHTLVIIGCFIPAFLAAPAAFGPLWQHIGAMATMFAVSYIMFVLGMMGGGDSKLASALGLWVGFKGVAPFILFMAMMGGIIGMASIVIRKKKPFKNPMKGSWIEQAQKGRNSIPYGVAISFGFWAALFHTGILSHQLSEVFKIIH